MASDLTSAPANQRINMSCGQTPLSPACLAAIGEQLVEPVYYAHYPEVEKETCLLLKRLMHTKNGPMLMPGSAVYGLEAAMLSTVESGDHVLTVQTGVFGRLLTELARFAGGNTTEIALEEGQAVDPETIRGYLLDDPEIRQIALVHCETTTGTLNPIEAIGRMLKMEFPHVIYMVDCVSSFGGIEVRVDDWGIDLMVSTTQKCLNAPQGLALVVASEKAWDKIENLRSAPRAMGLGIVAATEKSAAPVATRIAQPASPDQLDMTELHRILFEDHGIAISSLARIGTMGFMAEPGPVLRTMSALEHTLNTLGWDVEVGAGVTAAREVFERSEVLDGRAVGSQDVSP